MTTTPDTLSPVLETLGFVMTSEYIPLVAGINWRNPPMLKYHVVVTYRGQTIYDGEYSLGIGHIEGYRRTGGGVSLYDEKFLIDLLTQKVIPSWPRNPFTRPTPTLAGVLFSVVNDGAAVNFASFEDWAGEFGYDTDSRKAEAIYKACLAIGLRWNRHVPESVRDSVCNVLENY